MKYREGIENLKQLKRIAARQGRIFQLDMVVNFTELEVHCDVEDMEIFLNNTRKSYRCHKTCHSIPQSAYVYQWKLNGYRVQSCDHVLRYENLDEDFQKLMTRFGN